jgi:hypothetical protein
MAAGRGVTLGEDFGTAQVVVSEGGGSRRRRGLLLSPGHTRSAMWPSFSGEKGRGPP